MGVRYGGRAKGTPNKKTIWLLESLTEHGYDYEAMLTKFLDKAAHGDRHALDMAHLLVKMVPYLANAPKSEQAQVQIDKLVINRIESKPQPVSIDTTAEGNPPLIDAVVEPVNVPSRSADVVNTPSQSEEKS